ncbi:MAG: bifunctional phosphoribosylaminoimidazolecarboxamide formyltransferase/IMP cyclohydrolase [Chlorobi bacterium]|nr:bifunctional phosphoribosylaminoimidazolecarboxamide formyltransferase/IMP cyclohydrolase [Chlorobiota bacterium]
MHIPAIRRALLSAWDKTGLVDFARALAELDVEIIATGGTATTLQSNGIAVTRIEQLTSTPELLDGRVKTLHPFIHAAILARRDDPQHLEQLRQYGITPIDLVYVSLYPFTDALSRTSDDNELIEMIDIGGPTLLRAASKNHKWVVPIVSPDDCTRVVEYLRASGDVPYSLRRQLAARAFEYTAWYDAHIADYFEPSPFDRRLLTVAAAHSTELRYGENPHQRAVLFGSVQQYIQQLHGKELSYNNLLDLDAALHLISEFAEPTVAIVKHTNPCGVGSGPTLLEAWEKAYATDTVSPFGGIVVANVAFDEAAAAQIHPLFTEIIVAPDFDDAAYAILSKKRDRRLVRYNPPALADLIATPSLRSLLGGILLQKSDTELYHPGELRVVTEREPTDHELRAMMFAWKVAKHVKSNAIVYAAPDRTLAIGAGQPSRVDSARIAAWKAQQFGINLHGSAVASDAFFPFADGVVQCAQAGATAIIQPGGSIRDEEVISAANERNMAMIFTGMRHFRH